jgi:acyl carrier protein
MSDAVAKRVFEMAADIFGVDPGDVGPSTTPDDIEEWDSFAQLNLIVAIEDEYGVEFDPTELGEVLSLGAIAEVVAARVA